MTHSTGSSAIPGAFLSAEEIRYGEPESFSGLTVIPLFGRRRAPFEYVLLARAVETADVTIEEVGGGTVPALRLVNRGAKPVLIVDGEHLVGVKQNRIVNTTILVPEKTTLDIPVSCVEQGRWSRPVTPAKPTSPALFLRTRAMKAEAVTASVRSSGAFLADQGAIWQGVEGMLAGLGAESPTAAMDAVYERRADDIAGYLKHLRCQANQTGVVAAVGGRAMCADVFDRPETLAGLWDRLVPSYAVEAMARPKDAGTVTVADGEAFIRGVLSAAVTEHPAIGRGTDLRITSTGLVGAALAVEETILHLALFRTNERSREPQGMGFASVDERRSRFASR